MNILEKLFNGDKKRLEEIRQSALKVDALKDEMASLDDTQLKQKTEEFKDYEPDPLPGTADN